MEWNILKEDLLGCIRTNFSSKELSKGSNYLDNVVIDLSMNGSQLRKKFKDTFKIKTFRMGFSFIFLINENSFI